eukprot:7253021-Prymnesium_polylepis.2
MSNLLRRWWSDRAAPTWNRLRGARAGALSTWRELVTEPAVDDADERQRCGGGTRDSERSVVGSSLRPRCSAFKGCSPFALLERW